VEIKDQAGAVVWPVDETLQQSIIHAVHLLQKRVRSLVQETAQRLWIGEARQPGQVLEGTVELKRKNDAVSKRSKPSTMG
jgi:hypothetical protein